MEPMVDAAGLDLSKEGLRNYLEVADQVADIARSSHALLVERCIAADDIFRSSILSVQGKSTIAASLLNLNSRLLYCSAIQTALTGHIAPLYPALRACLESACYGEAMTHDPSLAEIWMARHNDTDSKKRCRDAFGVKLVRAASKRLEDVLGGAEDLIINTYERHIDYGAHPNPAGITFGIQIGETADNWILNLPGPSTEKIEYGLMECFETGLFTALVIANSGRIPRDLRQDFLMQLEVRNEWQAKLAEQSSAQAPWPRSAAKSEQEPSAN